MKNVEIENRLKEIQGEEVVWIIYLGIILLSFYANKLERKYLILNDLVSKNKYHNVIILIFVVLLFVYFYFLNSSYSDIMDLDIGDSQEVKDLTYLSFIGSLLIALSGIIFLYIAVRDENANVEIAFN